MRDWGDAAYVRLGIGLGSAVAAGLHFRRVPGHDNIGQERQARRDRRHLFERSAAARADWSVVNGTLQRVDGLTLIEQRVDVRSEILVAQVADEVAGAQQFTERIARLKGDIAMWSAAEPVEDIGCRTPSRFCRGGDPQQGIPAFCDRPRRDGFADDPAQAFRHVETAREIELAVAEVREPGHSSKPSSLASPIAKWVKPWVSTATRSSSIASWRSAPSIAAPAWRLLRMIGMLFRIGQESDVSIVPIAGRWQDSNIVPSPSGGSLRQ